MKITDLLDERSIELHGKADSKQEVLDKMIDLMCASGNIKNREEYKKGVFAREEEGTTGVGDGIAIPHAKSDAVERPGLSAMILPDGVDYQALDDEPVHIVFLIAAPNTKENVHLDVLSKLSVLLMDDNFTNKIKNAKSTKEFLEIIDQTEQEKDEEDRARNERNQNIQNNAGNASDVSGNNTDQKYILAVTGCPTGIAHTYMAAEALEKAAMKLGYQIKVETRGSGGAKNVLTDQEIANADGIIVAADTQVPMERFHGKRVIQCQVSDGISKAEKLLNHIAEGNVNIYNASGNISEDQDIGKESVGHTLYKNLMNGISHMLPFVVGGGILIAIAFLIDGLAVDINSLSEAERGNFGSITEAAGIFKSIGDAAFKFMLPILAGYIAMSIADRPGLAVGIVGGYLASAGKSGFLGALAAGFIAGYVILALKKIFAFLPESLEGIKPVLIYPLLGILLIGLIMQYIIEPPVGALNTLLNDGLSRMNGTSKVLLGIVVAGMMAADMGGPINKAAYVFGTAAITAGNYDIMAAVMVGGMVPPCAIALATLVFKNKFTVEERKSGPINFVMGLSFITEGAIPFAAADPIRVLPACIVGSAVAGALSMAFGCTLMAPHGGIFVFLVVGNALLYLLSLVVGTVVGAAVLGLLKTKKTETA